MCVAVVLDADDGFRAGQPHIWISGLDPKEPVAIFWVNDRSALELDLRRSRRANLSWRLRSFAPADRRPRQVRDRTAASESCGLALPTDPKLNSNPVIQGSKAVVRMAVLITNRGRSQAQTAGVMLHTVEDQAVQVDGQVAADPKRWIGVKTGGARSPPARCTVRRRTPGRARTAVRGHLRGLDFVQRIREAGATGLQHRRGQADAEIDAGNRRHTR